MNALNNYKRNRKITFAMLPLLLAFLLLACGGDSNVPEVTAPHSATLFARDANNEAVKALELGDLKLAMDKANLAIKDDPLFAMPYYNRALIHLLNKRFAYARDSLKKCVELDESHGEAQLLLGLLLERERKIPESQSAYQSAKKAFTAQTPSTTQSEIYTAIAVYLGDGLAPGLEAVNILVAKYPDKPQVLDMQKHIKAGERGFFLDWIVAETSHIKKMPSTLSPHVKQKAKQKKKPPATQAPAEEQEENAP